MSIKYNGERNIKPTHPGEMLREDYMNDYNLTIAGLAEKLGVTRQTVNELVNERRSLSSTMALRLARLFGNSPGFWMNAQSALDLWISENENKESLDQIKPLQAA